MPTPTSAPAIVDPVASSPTKLRAIADVDDLIHPPQIYRLLVPRYEQVPHFKVTAYAVPSFLGEVKNLSKEYPWIQFGIHGWAHSHFECSSWTSDEAKLRIGEALKMGYAPIFKPPNWVCDIETEKACYELGVILHHHPTYTPQHFGLKTFCSHPSGGRDFIPLHTHILRNPVTDYIEEHPLFKIEQLKTYGEFLWPQDRVVEVS